MYFLAVFLRDWDSFVIVLGTEASGVPASDVMGIPITAKSTAEERGREPVSIRAGFVFM